MFEDVGHEISLKLILSLTDPDLLKQKQSYQDLNVIKKSGSIKTTQTSDIKTM